MTRPLEHPVWRVFLACLLLLWLRGTAADSAVPDAYPLAAVKPGLTGYGLTVFEGNRIEKFGVTILGLMKNSLGPRRDLVLARLTGDRVEETGVVSGMSGSPVYIDGELLGALSFRFGFFPREPIAGITPLAYMTQIPTDRTQPMSIAMPVSGWLGRFHALLTGGPLSLASPSLPSMAGDRRETGAMIDLPISVAGIGGGTVLDLPPFLAREGFAPVSGAGEVAVPVEGAAPLQPGSAVAVQLIRGDVDMTASGTVTFLDGDKVYAFGHRFFNFGEVDLPMAEARVIRVLSSPAGSVKITTSGRPIGRVSQDRTPGIMGHLGETAATIPVEVSLQDAQAKSRQEYNFQVMRHPYISPILLRFALLRVFQAADSALSTRSLEASVKVDLESGREVRLTDYFSSFSAYGDPATYAASILELLEQNEFSLPGIRGMRIALRVETDRKTATIAAVVPSTEVVEAGGALSMRVLLHPFRGAPREERILLQVPDSFPPGNGLLYVGEAAGMVRLQWPAGPPTPRSFSDLLALLRLLRRDDRLYAALALIGPGLQLSGNPLPSLPGSRYSLLSRGQGAGVLVAPFSLLSQAESDVGSMVEGFRQIPIRIVRPGTL